MRTDTPVVVVNCQLAALAIMRSLGPLGIPAYGVSGDRRDPALRSRYCRGRLILSFDETNPGRYLDGLTELARKLGQRAILIPTSDETAQFVADQAETLRRHYVFQDNPAALVRQLASKREMFQLAQTHGVPTPLTRFPQSVQDVAAYAEQGMFPVMLKGIFGNRLAARTQKKMEIVHSPAALLEAHARLEDPQCPNLMIQELIPGGDDQVYIFNGYFDQQSECLVGFTGYKIRQFPIHVGCASLGECRWVEEVARLTVAFMKAIGYRGILDIGYRLDPRDGRYKVLDINPRVGQAFRLFVAKNDHDVVKALYLDLTGQPQPPVVRREGRRWVIEDFDIISSYHYYREGTLRPIQWLRSFAGVEEAAWFSWRDPAPLIPRLIALSRESMIWLGKAVLRRVRRAGRIAAGTTSEDSPARGVLLVAYHFPPSAAVGGTRMANLAKGLSARGWDTQVLTIRERDVDRVDAGRLRDVEGIKIHRAAVLPTIERMYTALRSRRAGRAVPGPRSDAGSSAVRTPGQETALQAIKRQVLSFLALPDRERGWLLPATLAAIRQVRSRGLPWIVTSCPPYSAHLIGLTVKTLTRVRWAADFRDPWMTTGSKRLYPTSAASRRVESWLERKVIEKADLVLFNVDRLRVAYRERYAHVAGEKFVHVPNGIPPRASAGQPSPAKYQPFTLSYTGSLYLGRSPEPVCQAVSCLIREGRITPAEVRIKLVGQCREVDGIPTASLVQKYGLESVVEIHDPVPYEEAQEIIRRSHLALLFAPDLTYQVPAKLYDYLGAGTRILAIAGAGATTDLVRETGSGQAFPPNDVEGISSFIHREMTDGQTANGGSTVALARLDVSRITADLVAHMARVDGAAPPAGVR